MVLIACRRLRSFIFLYFLLGMSVVSSCSGDERLFYGSGPTNKKEIALTFDDGPGIYTERIVGILKKYNVKATFFMEGSQVEIRPLIAKMVRDSGYEIGTHTYSHPNFWKYTKDDKSEVLTEELEKSERVFAKILDLRPSMLRMPYGFVRPWVREVAKKRNYKIISWTFGCDWKKLSQDQLVSNYVKHVQPGAIFLMHDGGRHEATAEALPEIIENIVKQGYGIITIGEMFGLKKDDRLTVPKEEPH